VGDFSTGTMGIFAPALTLLYLEFRDGALYCYREVPHQIYEGLLTAPSKGVYFNRHIRGSFEYGLIRQPQ
jgi:hypothetical protein